MAALLDLCRFTPTSDGTADWAYSSALVGCQGPRAAGAVDGTAYKFYAVSFDQTQWELTEGVYNDDTQTFARTTVLYNSAGTGTASGQSGAGAKIDFSTVPNVAIVGVKEDIPSNAESNNFTDAQQTQLRRNINADFDPGTTMLFKQAVPPTGWTQVTDYNDAALRVVSGSPGSGGTNGFSSVMAQATVDDTTLTISQIPAHNHGVNDPTHVHGVSDPTHAHSYPGVTMLQDGGLPFDLGGDGSGDSSGGSNTNAAATGISIQAHATGITIQNNGSGGSHNHAITMDMKYVDVIIARKDAA